MRSERRIRIIRRLLSLAVATLVLAACGCAAGKKPPLELVTYGGSKLFRIGDRAYEQSVYREDTSMKYAELVGRTAEALSGKTRVYSLIVPTSYEMLLPEEAKGLIPDYADTEACISEIYAAMHESVTRVDAREGLEEHRSEFIFFRTDHHWTARGAYLGYEAFCASKSIEPTPLDAFRSVSYPGFLGSFYTQSGGDESLLPEETVEAFYPLDDGVTLTVTDENGVTETRPMVADVTELPPSAKYMTFAGGNNPYSVIENPGVTDGSVLIVVKESFGNPMLAFLCGHYSRIYVIDYRYWMGNLLDLARETNADELLFINSFSAVNTGSNVGFLAMIIDD